MAYGESKKSLIGTQGAKDRGVTYALVLGVSKQQIKRFDKQLFQTELCPLSNPPKSACVQCTP